MSRADLTGLTEADRVFGGAPSTWDQETLSLLEHATTVGYDAFPVSISVFDGSGRARFVSELSSLIFRKIPSKAFQPPERCTPAASILTAAIPPSSRRSGSGGALEFWGGAAVLLGLWTRPVAFVLSGEMAVAYFQFHQPSGRR